MLAIAMVGLPARGKTFIANKLARYLGWRGHGARVFNVGNYRREHLGANKPAAFFDPDDQDAAQARMRVAELALEDMLTWIAPGRVGIFDATNSTRDRRAMIVARCERAGVPVMFVETICNDVRVVEANIRATKLSLPEYADVDPSQAARDFRMRIAHYRRAYQPMSDLGLSWVKLIDDRQVVVNRVEAPIARQLVPFLFSLRQRRDAPLWITRHGESAFNVAGRIGGDAPLSERGEAFARALAGYFEGRTPTVWTSTLQRTRQTAAALAPSRRLAWRALDEIDAGSCDGMTYDEIASEMPQEFGLRQRDKLRYRYPDGESYLDLVERLDPVAIELESSAEPILVIGHQAILRVLYVYLVGLPLEACPHLTLPLHTLIELVPHGHRTGVRRLPFAV